jgi:hypothetical protein
VSARLDPFGEVWLCDFEFRAAPGERQEPLCLVAREWRSGRTLRLWADDLIVEFLPPFPVGAESLFVAYYASAELGCFRALGWPTPARVLDLFCEFRCLTNGLATPCGNGLLGALAYFGIDGIDAADKEEMRQLALRGGSYSETEKAALLDYCQTDVEALAKLLPAMLPKIDLPRALLRGRYMAAAAAMEWNGTPIDVELFDQIKSNWLTIKRQLVKQVDADYSVYVPTSRPINPETRIGGAISATAERYGVDPFALAANVKEAFNEVLEARGEREAALASARKQTGINERTAGLWEDAGHDHVTWPGLDTKARELAGEFPELGIGRGYVQFERDDTDYAGRLWELLREPARKITKIDPKILERAAEISALSGGEWEGERSFSAAKFAEWLIAKDIPWPRLPSGELALDADTFRKMARQYPIVAPLRELRHSLSELRLFDLAIGRDGRNRCLLSAFRAITGRNQPSNAQFIFGPSCWLRSLIRPEPGRAVAYVDWEQQEFGIAAALSGDLAMQTAYTSGDPHLTFAKQAGAVPMDATKETHAGIRECFKTCQLGVQYRMGSASLAQRLGQPEAYARELLRLHQATYSRFWKWSQAAVDHAMLHSRLWTVFGWQVHVGPQANPRSLANFPMQANGAEMLRLACCLATERGIDVCAPIHDALLVEGDLDAIDDVVSGTQAAMREASGIVLGGFELRTDAKIFRHPYRYVDPRGERFWDTIMGLLPETEPSADCGGYLPQIADPVPLSISFS